MICRIAQLVLSVALVLSLGTGPASAIYEPCKHYCDSPQGPNAPFCTYYGEGICIPNPNPCYMTCEEYQFCMGGYLGTAQSALNSSAFSQVLSLPVATNTETWINHLISLGIGDLAYGPCRPYLRPFAS